MGERHTVEAVPFLVGKRPQDIYPASPIREPSARLDDRPTGLVGSAPKKRRQTEGGNALASAATLIDSPPAAHSSGSGAAGCAAPDAWYALWTQSHAEQLVHDQLAAKGFHPFLPKLDVWSRRGGMRHVVRVPMFPGYLFLRGAIDKKAYLQICPVRGLVRVLGERWDRLAPIPDEELDAVARLSAASHPVLRHPYLKEGRRARIIRGALAGVEGVLIEDRSSRGLLVLSIELLRRSVAVVVDCTDVEPA